MLTLLLAASALGLAALAAVDWAEYRLYVTTSESGTWDDQDTALLEKLGDWHSALSGLLRLLRLAAIVTFLEWCRRTRNNARLLDPSPAGTATPLLSRLEPAFYLTFWRKPDPQRDPAAAIRAATEPRRMFKAWWVVLLAAHVLVLRTTITAPASYRHLTDLRTDLVLFSAATLALLVAYVLMAAFVRGLSASQDERFTAREGGSAAASSAVP